MNPISSWNAFAKPRTFPSLRPWIQWLRIQSFLSHFYIKPQPAALILTECRIASYLISTSNHNHHDEHHAEQQLLLISFLHQTTTCHDGLSLLPNCFLSHFYIKPQHQDVVHATPKIASYLISTSNHNTFAPYIFAPVLLLISFLHQTTTAIRTDHLTWWLLLISFLHQTTTTNGNGLRCNDCFLSHFYIKPQQAAHGARRRKIASYLISTSNHNAGVRLHGRACIASYLISTSNHNCGDCRRISPQIASYLISTSNHNPVASELTGAELLLISFLHQTTTQKIQMIAVQALLLISFLHQTTTTARLSPTASELLLISFLHQTTTYILYTIQFLDCFLSHFYIKPQRHSLSASERWIASYLISTSNHNLPKLQF